MSSVEDLTKLKDMIMAVADDIPEIVKSMDEVSEWNSLGEILANITTITELVKQLSIVATYAREVMTETNFEDKEVVKTVASIINEKVDLPWVPEAVEQMLFELGVGMVLKTVQQIFEKGTADIQKLSETVRDKVIEKK